MHAIPQARDSLGQWFVEIVGPSTRPFESGLPSWMKVSSPLASRAPLRRSSRAQPLAARHGFEPLVSRTSCGSRPIMRHLSTSLERNAVCESARYVVISCLGSTYASTSDGRHLLRAAHRKCTPKSRWARAHGCSAGEAIITTNVTSTITTTPNSRISNGASSNKQQQAAVTRTREW